MKSTTQSPPAGPRPKWAADETDFYTKANFLRAFGEYHDESNHDPDINVEDPAMANRAEDEGNILKLLQAYLKGVAYLCDVKKGGTTVSANGIDQNLKLYIAANTNLHSSVKIFVVKVLTKTDILSRPTKVVVREILEEAVKMAWRRGGFYVKQLGRFWGVCRASLESQFRGIELLSWIGSLIKTQDHYQLVVKCYEACGRQLKELKIAAAACGHIDWMDLIHHIGRLGAHNYHIIKVVTAYKKQPFLQQISEIVFIPSSPKKLLTLPDSAFDYSAVSMKVSKNSDRSALIQRVFNLLLMARWHDSRKELKAKLEEKRKISTRVHAEILIFDYFEKNGLEFLHGYQYIGCSKPACYFCYHWLQCQRVWDLRSHSKVILECRGPDLSDSDANVDATKRGYNHLVRIIAERIFRQVISLDDGMLGASETRRYHSSQGSSFIPPSRSEVSVRS